MVKKPKGIRGAECFGSSCDWALIHKSMECVDGAGGCSSAYMCEAEESAFHDKNLVEASKKINRILRRIPVDPKGRKLSFCSTNMGIFLAWVQHGGKYARGRRITRQDDDPTVTKALKIKPPAKSKK